MAAIPGLTGPPEQPPAPVSPEAADVVAPRRVSDGSREIFALVESDRSDEALDTWAAHVVSRIDDGASDMEVEALIRHPVHRGIPASALFRAGLRHIREEGSS